MRFEDVKSDNEILKERIRRLERLVATYTGKESALSSPASSPDESGRWHDLPTDEDVTRDMLGPGQLTGKEAGAGTTERHGRYRSLTSWDSVIMELDELKFAINDVSRHATIPPDGDSMLKSFSGDGHIFPTSNMSFETLYGYLPDRGRMDGLLSQYFHSYHPFYSIIHPLVFKKQYQAFLLKPRDPVMLSQLFGMMAMAVANNDPDDRLSDLYAKCALQALQLSEFTVNFNVMTVVSLLNIMFYYQRERLQHTFTWIFLGLTLQIARALGLHRDPLHFGITGQDCQMRRHIWSAIMSQDTIHAARYGRVTSIDAEEYDTKPPEDHVEEGGNPSEPTPAFYTHKKRAVAVLVSRVFRLLFRPRARPSYQTLLEVEGSVRNVHDNLPHCEPHDVHASAQQNAIRWLYHMYTPFVLSHLLLIIHRPFLVQKSAEFHHSRIICLQNARSMLEHVFEAENRPDLEHYAWHIRELRNITYVPVATLLCVGLYIRAHPEFEPLPEDAPVASVEADRQLVEEILRRLQPGSNEYQVVDKLYNKVISRSASNKLAEPSVPLDVTFGMFPPSSEFNHIPMTHSLEPLGGQDEWQPFLPMPAPREDLSMLDNHWYRGVQDPNIPDANHMTYDAAHSYWT